MRVRVLRSAATYTATFARPAYEFVARWVDLFAAIHHRLSPFGARPNDTRYDNPTGQPHDLLVSWMNFDVNAVARYRLGSLEVWTGNPLLIRGETPRVAEVILAAIAAATDIAQGLSFVSQSANVEAHGRLEEGTVVDLVGKVVRGPAWARPEGVRFKIAAADGIDATVDFQPSLSFLDPKNAWAGVTLNWPGSMQTIELSAKTASFVNETLTRAGVDLDWGDQ